MNRLILIGNGFDLAHGLKTSYKDFINWFFDKMFLNFNSNTSSVSFDGNVGDEFKLCSFRFNNSPASRIYQKAINARCSGIAFYEYLKNNKTINEVDVNPTNFLDNICRSIETKGWADIEREYYNLLTKCGIPNPPYPITTVDGLNDQMEILQKMLIDYLNQEFKKKNPVKNAEIYKKIYAPVNDDDLSVRSPSSLEKKIEDIMLLDFNYTNTADLYVDANRKCEHIHIHGKLDNPKSVIFGYGDELDEMYKQLQNTNDNRYLDKVKSIKYLESDNCRKVLQFIESAPFQVCIMGHSCGNSDRTLLNTIFEHKNCISIKSYYHKRKGGSDDFRERGQNISRIFNNQELMGYRVVSKDHCEPLT